MDIVGQVLAIAAGDAGLILVDVSDPKSLRIAGRLDFEAHAVALDLQATLALIATDGGDAGGGGLLVVDVSSPANPTLLGSIQLGASGVADVTVWENYAFASGFGVDVVDFSDPHHPTEVGTFFRGGWEMLVSPSGRRLYSLTQTAPPQDSFALDVIDVSNPSSPFLVTTIPGVPDAFEGLAASEDNLYTVDPARGLLVFDVGEETGAPELVAVHPGTRSTADLRLSQQLLLSSEGSGGLGILEVSLPSVPAEVGRVFTSAESLGLRVAYSTVFLRTGNGLRLLDLAAPSSLIDRGYFATDPRSATFGGLPSEFLVANGLAFVPDFSGVRILDVSAPGNPIEVGTWLSPSPARSVALSGSILYVGLQTPTFESDPALYVLDVGDPATPVQLAALENGGWWPERLLVHGSLLIGSDPVRTGECWIFDISVPTAPARVASCDFGPRVRDMQPVGDLLFQAETDRFSVVDVSVPATPALLSFLQLEDPFLSGVALAPDRAYLSHREAGIEVIDATLPASPRRAGHIDSPGTALDIAAAAGLLLVADGAAGLSIYSDCVLFADGFESGDSAAWSVSIP